MKPRLRPKANITRKHRGRRAKNPVIAASMIRPAAAAMIVAAIGKAAIRTCHQGTALTFKPCPNLLTGEQTEACASVHQRTLSGEPSYPRCRVGSGPVPRYARVLTFIPYLIVFAFLVVIAMKVGWTFFLLLFAFLIIGSLLFAMWLVRRQHRRRSQA
jgi:hypothetical protein